MAEITNLKAVRKSRKRDAARVQADANAAKFGRSKAEKARDQAQAEKSARDLDGAKRQP